MKRVLKLVLLIGFGSVCGQAQHNPVKESSLVGLKNKANIDVAAYFWPSLQDETRSREKLWSSGQGEWEVIKRSKPRFNGHYQPRQPLHGYELDDNPQSMERQIIEATSHGVNTFIFDWYWYDGKPFLEEALNDGFLKAKNKNDMKFYLMWANHDVPGNMWNPYRYKNDSLVFQGNVTKAHYEDLVSRVIDNYFKESNYYQIDGRPVFSIYSLKELVESFGSLREVKKVLDYFRGETIKAGFKGLHLQLVGKYGINNTPTLGENLDDVDSISRLLGANSVTMYNMAGNEYRKRDYINYLVKGKEVREKWDKTISLPFVPCISVGWDNTPRYLNMNESDIVYLNNTPASFGAGLLQALHYVQDRPDQPQLLIINAWNEWVEGSYLRPDMLNGYTYLQAVQEALGQRKTKSD